MLGEVKAGEHKTLASRQTAKSTTGEEVGFVAPIPVFERADLVEAPSPAAR